MERRPFSVTRQLRDSPETVEKYRETHSQKELEERPVRIRKIPKTEKKPFESCYLPPDKATTRTSIVSDAAAKCEGISLAMSYTMDLSFPAFNTVPEQAIELVCGIAEMYLCASLKPEDIQCNGLVWRALDQTKVPDEIEFK